MDWEGLDVFPELLILTFNVEIRRRVLHHGHSLGEQLGREKTKHVNNTWRIIIVQLYLQL